MTTTTVGQRIKRKLFRKFILLAKMTFHDVLVSRGRSDSQMRPNLRTCPNTTAKNVKQSNHSNVTKSASQFKEPNFQVFQRKLSLDTTELDELIRGSVGVFLEHSVLLSRSQLVDLGISRYILKPHIKTNVTLSCTLVYGFALY